MSQALMLAMQMADVKLTVVYTHVLLINVSLKSKDSDGVAIWSGVPLIVNHNFRSQLVILNGVLTARRY